jgi:predicted unusual protein kinase regulating ubiquinone biosynthesis (AarF/ABC1/UbiB family)
MFDVKSRAHAGGASSRGDGIPRRRLWRVVTLLALTVRTTVGTVFASLNRRLTGADPTGFHARTAERYAEFFGQSKGALMKAGQMLSLAPIAPVVPSEFQFVYRAALARLRDDAPPMSPALARAALEAELGPVEEAFGEFDWRPLAAASVGQVHAARLHDGRRVAVKIQYPGVAEAIAVDLRNVELLAAFVHLWAGCLLPRSANFDFRAVAREIGIRISEELDYRVEAAYQMQFADLYRGHPFIRVPEVVPELSTDRVLTQEFVRGRSWAEAVEAKQDLRNRWAETIWRFVYGSNARFRLLHADPHPGNYVFHDDGSVSFLDFGCVKRFGGERPNFMAVIGLPCLEGDVLGTWHACSELGFCEPSDPLEADDWFAYWHACLEMYWGEQPFTITPEYAARWMELRVAPDGFAGGALRQANLPPEYTVMGRIEIGMMGVFSQLRACVDWRSLGAEYFRGDPPQTPLGRLDHDFFDGDRRVEVAA